MATKFTYSFNPADETTIKAKLLHAGDFFSNNGYPWICLGTFSSPIGSQIRCARISDMKPFSVRPDDEVQVYSTIEITYKRI
jgi:hypothetical protein